MSSISTKNCNILDLQQSRENKNIEVDAQLDQMRVRMQRLGLSDEAVLDAVFAWAARRAYDTGGYPAARTLMLDALERILFRESANKSAR